MQFVFRIHRISVADVTKYVLPADCVLFYRNRIEAVFNNNETTAEQCAAGQ